MSEAKTVFNDPEKARKAREETADYFKSGENLGDKFKEKLSGLLGMGESNSKRVLAQRMVKKSY